MLLSIPADVCIYYLTLHLPPSPCAFSTFSLSPEEDLDEALTGGIGEVLLLDQTTTVGFARLSQSGLAMNIVIDTQLHTVPMRSLTPVLTGHHRKAPLFVPAEDLAQD